MAEGFTTQTNTRIMTDDEIRIAIANDQFPQFPIIKVGSELRHQYPNGSTGPVYNYPEDLNAMHSVEKTLKNLQAMKFRLLLQKNSDGPKAEYRTVEAAMCHATARQRAEAYLRTIGKWK